MNTNVQEAAANHELFHFKVMELKTFEDGQPRPTCKCLFNFNFPKIKKTSEAYLKDFEFDVTQDPKQRLYLSKDTTLMMEVINGLVAKIYRRQNVDTGEFPDDSKADNGQKVKWIPREKGGYITRFPIHLSKYTSVNYLFSPNFTYMIDYVYADKQIIIKKTEDQKVYVRIPTELIELKTTSDGGGRELVAIYASRI